MWSRDCVTHRMAKRGCLTSIVCAELTSDWTVLFEPMKKATEWMGWALPLTSCDFLGPIAAWSPLDPMVLANLSRALVQCEQKQKWNMPSACLLNGTSGRKGRGCGWRLWKNMGKNGALLPEIASDFRGCQFWPIKIQIRSKANRKMLHLRQMGRKRHRRFGAGGGETEGNNSQWCHQMIMEEKCGRTVGAQKGPARSCLLSISILFAIQVSKVLQQGKRRNGLALVMLTTLALKRLLGLSKGNSISQPLLI